MLQIVVILLLWRFDQAEAWRTGRATFFGADAWSIHRGGCNYGYLWEDQATGWDVVALSDAFPGYVGSCGSCFEVSCDPSFVSDSYGQQYDRRSVCIDPSASVIVRVVDTCPCKYGPNQYSNQRWCCGDEDHMDLSVWAFEKLADKAQGVIGIKYRPIACTHYPDNPASRPFMATPGNPQKPPPGTPRNPVRDWPEIKKSGPETPIYRWGWVQNGFNDVSSTLWRSSKTGVEGLPAFCATVPRDSAIRFRGWNGMLDWHIGFEFWLYVGVTGYDGSSAKVPDVTLSILGSQGECDRVRVTALKPMMFVPMCPYCPDYYFGYKVYLTAFNTGDSRSVMNDPGKFQGCAGNSAWDFHTLVIQSTWGTRDEYVCLDRLQLI